MKNIIVLFALIIALFVVSDASAQCAMCQATAESSRDAGSTAAEGINHGVLYLFLTPYLIVASIGYFWWRARKSGSEQPK